MPAPTTTPDRRDPAEIRPTDSYRPAEKVWVYRDGGWRAGVVEVASAHAATVTYRPGGFRGTGVDTLTARYMSGRAVSDPVIDDRRGL
jgi:hypothetical protein